MRVILNQSTALGAKTGIGQYTVELLTELRRQAPYDTFDVFPPSWWGSLRRLGSYLRPSRKPDNGAKAGVVSTRLRAFGDRALAGCLRVTTALSSYDLYHEPNIVPLPSALPTVATIQDLSVLVHPKWHPADRVAFYERQFAGGLAQCRHLIAISEFTRREVMRVLGVPGERIMATPLGVRADLQLLSGEERAPTLARLGLPREYLLFVGTIEPRKNLGMLMRAFCDLPASLRERCPLVLAGSWGWNAAEFREYYEQEGRAKGVVHLGYVADENLGALYSGARALVFPSHYEGFGLPPLEMMACGGAVLASTAGALVEVVGVKAHLTDANDLVGWRGAMHRVIVDDAWRDALRDGAVAFARQYSWERCARQTLDVYRVVIGASSAKMAG